MVFIAGISKYYWETKGSIRSLLASDSRFQHKAFFFDCIGEQNGEEGLIVILESALGGI